MVTSRRQLLCPATKRVAEPGTVVLVLSGATYAAALKAMHRPVVTGKEAIVRGEGVVEHSVDGVLSVRILGERWAARADGLELEPGDHVTVVGIDGLTLCVKRKD
jgi:membrane protein implicated in regulation of membrane protease activity